MRPPLAYLFYAFALKIHFSSFHYHILLPREEKLLHDATTTPSYEPTFNWNIVSLRGKNLK